jgi:hypothetical protein
MPPWVAYVFSASMLVLTTSPLFRDPPRDSFPFSDFPMFARGRPDPEMILEQAVGVTADGVRMPLSPMVASANREVLQSLATIRRAIFGGPDATRRFCTEVATRVTLEGAALDAVTEVEVVSSRFDAVAYFVDRRDALSRHVYARCRVARP